MKIHEYQAKEIFRRFGVPVPRGGVAASPGEARAAALKLGGGPVVLKAQVHAGGRGKAGGIKLVRELDQVESVAAQLIGMKLVTAQTGPKGRLVRKLLVEEGLDIADELYAGITLDRALSRLMMMVSREGGVEIEEVAGKHPEAIHKQPVDPLLGLQPFQARSLAFKQGYRGRDALRLAGLLLGLYRVYTGVDASLVEVNPLVKTKAGDFLALDAKINLDDNSLFRHPDLAEMRGVAEEEPLEVEAGKYHLNYIKLDGDVGCMVNGAGLAMATMDIIKQAGAMPANFLDVGGGASEEAVTNGFRILLSDPSVRSILVNIFGGIVRCDRVARGIIAASKQVRIDRPMVVRLQGTNAEEGLALLRQTGELPIETASSFKEAAQKVARSLRPEVGK